MQIDEAKNYMAFDTIYLCKYSYAFIQLIFDFLLEIKIIFNDS
jgi:hypothetical protein